MSSMRYLREADSHDRWLIVKPHCGRPGDVIALVYDEAEAHAFAALGQLTAFVRTTIRAVALARHEPAALTNDHLTRLEEAGRRALLALEGVYPSAMCLPEIPDARVQPFCGSDERIRLRPLQVRRWPPLRLLLRSCIGRLGALRSGRYDWRHAHWRRS